MTSASQVANVPPYGRDFRIFLLGQGISLAGDRIATIALVFLIIRVSGSFAPALALFYIARAVPTLVGGLVAGVLADHFARKSLMIACDLSRGCLLVVVPSLAGLSLATIYPMVAFLYTLSLMFNTAARAALPDIVPEARMLGANAILSGMQTAADMAYAAGGLLIFVLKFQAPFYIDAATFVCSAASIWAMHVPGRTTGSMPSVREFGFRIRAGIRFLFGHPFLRWSTMAYIFAPAAGGAGFVLTPLYASGVLARSGGLSGPLHSGAFRFSVLEVSLGLGAFAGSWVTTKLATRWPKGRLFGAGIAASGLADALLGLVTNLYAAILLLAVSGVFTSMFFITGATLVQTLTPTEIRGRVLAARATIVQTALAAGSALAGVALLALSVQSLWIIEGGVLVGASLFIWLRSDVRSQP